MIKEDSYYLWTTGRGLYVLLGLLFLGIFVSPLSVSDGLMTDVFAECIFVTLLITGAFVTPCRRSVRLIIVLAAFLAVMTRVLHKFNTTNHTIAVADNILAAITLIAFSYLITKHFLFGKVLLQYRIAAAVGVYLILGVLWGRFYEIVHLFNPSAFSLNEHPYSLLYFSFVTLTTIGYGDIVPLSVMARSLAILEGVVGQLYMVILISSLVSKFSSLSGRPVKE